MGDHRDHTDQRQARSLQGAARAKRSTRFSKPAVVMAPMGKLTPTSCQLGRDHVLEAGSAPVVHDAFADVRKTISQPVEKPHLPASLRPADPLRASGLVVESADRAAGRRHRYHEMRGQRQSLPDHRDPAPVDPPAPYTVEKNDSSGLSDERLRRKHWVLFDTCASRRTPKYEQQATSW